MSERRTVLTLIPSMRYKNNTSKGKFDLVILRDSYGKEYRYNIPANANADQRELSRAIGGFDKKTGHYCETNLETMKISATLETICGYTWLIQPRLIEICKEKNYEAAKRILA